MARRASSVTALAVLCALGTMTFGPGTARAASSSSTSSSTSPSSATTSTSASGSSSQSQIDSAEAQVAALETQISQQQAVLDRADEQYNQAQVNLSSTQSSLQTTTASINAAKARLTTERSHLRADAIQAYMSDSASTSAASLFGSPSSANQTRDFYQQLGSSAVATDVARIQAGQRQLTATQTKLLAEQQAETAQLAQVDQARQGAETISAQSEATLAQVKGNLAAQIAQQAAAQAKTAALTAATATNPAAAQAAAAQAAQAAQVATTLSGGSAAAVNATTAANQATTEAAGTSSTGSGAVTVSPSGSAQAAGLAAVHGAMKYLNVPYAWGGVSMAGVDCSGLTMLAWSQAGVSMDHSAADQYAQFPHVSLNALQPGDLIFYDLDGSGIDHVVMYVGPTLDGRTTTYGSGTIIQAAHTGTFVTFDPIWYEGLVGAARP
jgi:cell wall-associated NlpC family hydrolase